MADHDARARVVQLALQLDRGRARVVLADDGAKAQHREQGHDVLGADRQQQGDAITRPHAQVGQGGGKPVDLVEQLAVGEGVAEEVDGLDLGEVLGGVVEEPGQRHLGVVVAGWHTRWIAL